MVADAHADIGAYSRHKVFAYEVVARHKADTGLDTESPSLAVAILRNGGIDEAVELAECHVFVLAASDDLIVFCEIDFERIFGKTKSAQIYRTKSADVEKRKVSNLT